MARAVLTLADGTKLDVWTALTGAGDVAAAAESAVLIASDGTVLIGQKTMAGSLPVALASDQPAVPVSGTFWPGTQPVSAASLPLPTGAATEAGLGTDGTAPPAVLGAGTGIRGWLRSIYEKLTGSLAVTGTFWQATQPVSGTVTSNVGTTNGLALDATLTGGTQKAIARGGAKGATAAADLTGTAEGADHQAADVQLYHGGAAISPLTDAQLRASAVPVSAAPTKSATSTETNVAGTTTAGTTILAANAARLGATIYNNSTATLTLHLGSGQTSTLFTVKMATESLFEVPFSYTGIITGSWASATGSARVVEFT